MARLRDRFQQVPGRHKPRPIRNGLIVFALFGFLLLFLYTSGKLPFLPKGGTVVTADFATAANVTAGKTPVRVAGVDVGTVESLDRLPGGRGVRIKMRIKNGKGVKLMSDAKAHIYWRTLLGFAFYIQLEPGNATQGLGSKVIPESDTTTQVEADQVLAALKPTSRKGIQTTLKEFDKGFDGNAAGDTIDNLGPSMKELGPGLGALRGTQPGDLTQTIRQGSRLMGALAKNEVTLGNLVTNANQALGVTAARRADLAGILDNAPSALAQTDASARRLRVTLDNLDPVADDLRPGARKLDDMAKAVQPALKELQPVLDDARPLLRDVNPALRSLKRASDAGVPFLQKLDPTLDRVKDPILPALDTKGATGLKFYEAIAPAVAAVGNSAQQFDVFGHVQRFHAVAGSSRTLSSLPCTPDLQKLAIKCEDFQQYLGRLVGIDPVPGEAGYDSGKTSQASQLSSSPDTKSGSDSSSGGSTPTTANVTGAVDRIVHAIKRIF